MYSELLSIYAPFHWWRMLNFVYSLLFVIGFGYGQPCGIYTYFLPHCFGLADHCVLLAYFSVFGRYFKRFWNLIIIYIVGVPRPIVTLRLILYKTGLDRHTPSRLGLGERHPLLRQVMYLPRLGREWAFSQQIRPRRGAFPQRLSNFREQRNSRGGRPVV